MRIRNKMAVLIFILMAATAKANALSSVTVDYTIRFKGVAASEVNAVGFDHYSIKAADNTGALVTYTTNDVGWYENPSVGFTRIGVRLTPTYLFQGSPDCRVSVTVPVTLSVSRTASESSFYSESANVVVEKTLTPCVATASITTSFTKNFSISPPALSESTGNLSGTAFGLYLTLTAASQHPLSTNPEIKSLLVAVSSNGNFPSGQCYPNQNTTVYSVANTAQSLVVGSVDDTIHNVRVCTQGRYGRNSGGILLSASPGSSKDEAIYAVGRAPSGVASDTLGVHSSGYFYNSQGLKEKWFVRGVAAPGTSTRWSYLLPNGRLYHAVGSIPAPSTDALVADLGNYFILASNTYRDSGFVYDHPQLLTTAPTLSRSYLQLRTFNEVFKFSPHASGSFFVDYLGRGEKWFRGRAGTVEGWYFIEPSGAVYEAPYNSSTSTYEPRLIALLPATMFGSINFLILNWQRSLDNLYRFYRVNNSDSLNFAGLNEKWFKSSVTGFWYYITPVGDVFRWDSGTKSGPAAGLDPRVFRTSANVYNNHLPLLVDLVP